MDQGAIERPVVEVVAHGIPIWKVRRQESPGAASAVQIEEGIDYVPQIDGRGTAHPPFPFDDGPDQLPLVVSQISRVAAPGRKGRRHRGLSSYGRLLLPEIVQLPKRPLRAARPNTMLHGNAREQRTVGQPRHSPTARMFGSAARVQIGEANLLHSCDGVPYCLDDLAEGASGLVQVLTYVSPPVARSMSPGRQDRSWPLSTAWRAPEQLRTFHSLPRERHS